MLDRLVSRRSFLKGVGAVTTVGALAPVSMLINTATSAEVYATALLLGTSIGFVSEREPYVWAVDAAAAARLGISGRDLAFVEAAARNSTGTWLGYSTGAAIPQLDRVFRARLEAFYRAFASWDLSLFETFETGKARGSTKSSQRGPGLAAPMLNHCSGQDVPAACPPRFNYWMSWATKAQVESFLTSSGYHLTAGYAGGDGLDWTVQMVPPAAFPNCGIFGCFRSQARGFGSGSSWSFNLQEPEPNPEIWFTYTWPEWWWGTYVNWWHHNYC